MPMYGNIERLSSSMPPPEPSKRDFGYPGRTGTTPPPSPSRRPSPPSRTNLRELLAKTAPCYGMRLKHRCPDDVNRLLHS